MSKYDCLVAYSVILIHRPKNLYELWHRYKNKFDRIPSSHVTPVYPGAHEHMNSSTPPSEHVPPFKHGLDEHSLMSEIYASLLETYVDYVGLKS